MSTPVQDDVVLTDKKPSHTSRAHAAAKKLHPKLRRYRKPAMVVGGIVLFILISFWVHDAFTHEETDNAYITGHMHNVSTRINAVATEVEVKDNQYVHEGDVLVKFDPSEYQALTLAAQAELDKAKADLDRDSPMEQLHALSPQDLDAARSSVAVDIAQLKLAELQIDYSTIRAPASGTIGRKNVEVGNRVSSGQTLMVVVEPDLWVVANFKETQLARMRAGQPAKVTIDAIPGKVFEGHVNSFSPATGNAFALLPADNSTGNFTKIVQRVPVKIVFDPASTKGYEDRIRAGESAIVKVELSDPAAASGSTQVQAPDTAANP